MCLFLLVNGRPAATALLSVGRRHDVASTDLPTRRNASSSSTAVGALVREAMRSAEPQDSARQHQADALLGWLVSEGATFEGIRVGTTSDSAGFGIFATCAIAAGGGAFRCPCHVVLTAEAALSNSLIGEALRCCHALLDDEKRVMLLLMHCRSQGTSSDRAAYVASLPPVDEAKSLLPVHWDDAERGQLLAGTTLLQQARAADKALQRFHVQVVEGVLCKRWPQAFPRQSFSLDALRWAHAMWHSRAIRLPLPGGARESLVSRDQRLGHDAPSERISGSALLASAVRVAASPRLLPCHPHYCRDTKRCCLDTAHTCSSPRLRPPMQVPLLDMMNHSMGSVASSVRLVRRSKSVECDSFELRCDRAVAAGSQLYLNYGAKGNGELLRCHGFVLADNAADVVEIDVMDLLGVLQDQDPAGGPTSSLAGVRNVEDRSAVLQKLDPKQRTHAAARLAAAGRLSATNSRKRRREDADDGTGDGTRASSAAPTKVSSAGMAEGSSKRAMETSCASVLNGDREVSTCRHFLFRDSLPPRLLDDARLLCACEGEELAAATRLAREGDGGVANDDGSNSGGCEADDGSAPQKAGEAHVPKAWDWSLVDWSADDPFAAATAAVEDVSPIGVACERRTLAALQRLLAARLICLPDLHAPPESALFGCAAVNAAHPGGNATGGERNSNAVGEAQCSRREAARTYVDGQRRILEASVELLRQRQCRLECTS